jgi:hypothetical protein
MNIEPIIIGYAIYLLFWEKLPEWGTLFNRFIDHLPKPLQTLYGDWRCPYCSGFWIALAVHGLTGLQTLPALNTMPDYLGTAALPLAWFLDALATAALVLFVHLAFSAISGPAIQGHKLRAEFKASMAQEDAENTDK